ncbi:hypothetical protein [Phenylobacterium sp.]|uniref:hypothetical protein n=1 Tax=Phenylobacterium sp. TaxID=1871053 RepID=UPI002F94F723
MFHQPVRTAHGGNDGDGEAPGGVFGRLPFTIEGDDLPYKVEVLDPETGAVERVIAIAADATIGFAAYYAAARENPGRDIVITHKGNVLAKWVSRAH